MQQYQRLRRSEDFQRLREVGVAHRNRLLVVSFSQNELMHNRYGFIVGKQLGNAVTRNRIRRRLREVVRALDSLLIPGYDVVLQVVMIPLVLSAPRVAARVAAGGHDVPTDKLGMRYARLWPHVVTALPHCHQAIFYDNSRDDGPLEVAAYRCAIPDYGPRWPRWTPDALLAI